MATDFDRIEEDCQKQTPEEPQGVYSDTVVERFYNPENLGRLTDPDAYGIVHGWCGDTMEIYLRLTGEGIKESRFMTDGCLLTAACGSMLTTMIEGLSAEEAQEITPQQLIEALNGLPEENAHCAKLAVETLHEAIRSLSDEQSGA
ncbi:iron-sulfur cluster assembly scaffold protein [Candidatus Bipolaricaulota bacterium]